VTELHLGAEYFFFPRDIPLAVRAGFYTDPDHRPRYKGPDIFSRFAAPGGPDRYHGTVGFGIVPVPGFQIDVGVNVSSGLKELAISSVYRF